MAGLAHKTSLTPPLLIEVSVPSQESKWSCICVRSTVLIYILPLSDFAIGFWNCSDIVVFYYYG
jgi:hypothetical protein